MLISDSSADHLHILRRISHQSLAAVIISTTFLTNHGWDQAKSKANPISREHIIMLHHFPLDFRKITSWHILAYYAQAGGEIFPLPLPEQDGSALTDRSWPTPKWTINAGTTQEQVGQWNKPTSKIGNDHNENGVATESSGTSWVWKHGPAISGKETCNDLQNLQSRANQYHLGNFCWSQTSQFWNVDSLWILVCCWKCTKATHINAYQPTTTRLKSYQVTGSRITSACALSIFDSDASSFDWLLVWILFHRCPQCFVGRFYLLNLLSPAVDSVWWCQCPP